MDASKRMPVTTEPQSSVVNSRVVLGQASSLSHIDVSTQADIHHAATSYESEDEIMGRRSNRVGSGTDMSRCNKRGTPLYSKEDIREQYCITSRQLDVLDKRRGGGDAGNGVSGGFFGCLSTYSQNSPCSASGRSSLLSVCVRRKVPSDENLYELCRRQPADYAPIPRYPRYPFGAVPPELYQYDENLDCSYFRRRPKSFCTMADPKRYTWMPEDEESIRMERPRPIRPDLDEYDSIQRTRPASRQSTLSGGTVTPHYMSYSSEYLPAVHGHYVCPAHPDLPPPPPPPLVPTVVHRTKHVSFARSHTLTSFDDAKISIATRSQERLLDGKKTADPMPLSRQGDGSESPKIVVLEKMKRGPMKTQATQTEVCLGRKPLPPNQLSLSPRTIHRVRMVSQGAQTNGILNNGRKLTKSYSEAGSRFGVGTVAPPTGQHFQFNESQKSPTLDHEPLQRTQSEEPPKSPFLISSSPPPPSQLPPESPEKEPSVSEKESEKSDHEETDSETKSQKEIIIDFEPQLSPDLIEPLPKKRILLKTMSEGEILQERRKSQITDHELIPDNMIISTSQENIKSEPEQARSFTPYFLNSPILHEDIFKEPPSGPPSTVFSPITSNLKIQESIDEEFHENLICGTLFRKRSVSMEDGVSSTSDPDLLDVQQKSTTKSAPSSPGMETLGRSESKMSEDDGVVPTCKTISPFASSDSLANDLRDHSDGIWNESQATVLQADSGTENGTVLSTSDLSSLTTAVSPSVTLLTPSSRRKHLLMLQHQQRSSMDTDALEEEFQADQNQVQSPALPRLKKDMSAVGVHVLPPPPTIAVTTPPKSVDASHISSPVLPTRRSPARGELRKRRSPLTRTPDLTPSETPHRSLESPDNTKAIQTAAEMLLQKTDSGKTTDISESTTTTDDYVTANSDSSRRSGSLQGTSTQSTHGSQTGTQDGSSFESASSIYSLARGEAVCEDMIVPSFSPPPIIEETTSDIPLSPAAESKCPTPPISQRRASSKEPTSPSGTSSSSGSYSLNGSCDNLQRQPDHQHKDQRSKTEHKPIVPSPPRTAPKEESISDDECSAHYSSGYYESPGDEEVETESRRKISRRTDRKEWTEDEKRRRKKGFTLDFNRREKEISMNGQQREKSEKTPTEEIKAVDKKSPSSLSPKDITQSKQVHEKTKRVKSRSPQRPQRKLAQASSSAAAPYVTKKSDKEVTTPGMVRSPAMHDGFRPEDWAIVRTPPHEDVPQISTNAGTSDESSGGFGKKEPNNIQQLSPRRHRRVRETTRRKSGPNLVCSRSPTSSLQRGRRRSGSIEDKSVSLPGSLPRRRSSMQPKSNLEEDTVSELTPKSNRLSPHKYTRSPGGSPRKIRSPKTGIEGSPETKLKAVSAESLRSVSPGSDSVFYSESGSNTAAMMDQHQCVHCLHCGKEVDIVTTDDIEEGAAMHDKDQPDIVRPPAGFADSPDGPRVKHTSGRLYKKLEKRYRSEERSHGERRHHHRYKQDMRAKSEERGKDDTTRIKLRPLARSTDASLEVLKATASSPSVTNLEDEDDMGIYAESYRSAIWIFIGDSEEMHVWHRPDTPRHTDDDDHSIGEFSDIGIRSRKESDSSTGSTESEHEFKKKYQCVTHRMVHRKSCLEMYKRQADKSFESDKTVIVRRECGEFGFRIHGSKPVVVSAIEPDTPAESSGLEVGDIVIAVNGINVLDKSHSEVVKIAHAGSDTLRLEVARTCDVLAPADEPGGGTADSLYSGYLWKFVAHTNKWIRRWFVLKRNNCLYYYKTDAESQPVGAIMLINYEVTRTTPECAGGKQYAFSITKSGYTGLQLAADNEEAATRWIAVVSHAVERSTATDTWLETAKRNLRVAPIQLPKPDCFGYLMKLGTKWKAWSKRYCVLKDACLYFYHDANAKNAFGMTCLHGYRVQQAAPAGKKHAFEVIPPDPTQKHLYFHTESDLDRKRWLAALEYSIDRWLRVG